MSIIHPGPLPGPPAQVSSWLLLPDSMQVPAQMSPSLSHILWSLTQESVLSHPLTGEGRESLFLQDYIFEHF